MNWKSLKAGLAHAFAYDDGRDEVTEEDLALLDRVAGFVVRRRLATPAILLLESTGSLNFVGSSLMTFFRPILGMAFRIDEYERFERLLEKRCSPRLLVERIELRQQRRAMGGNDGVQARQEKKPSATRTRREDPERSRL
jgi:hypothetical protein